MIVVPSVELQQQWQELIRRHLPSAKVACRGGGKRATLVTCDVLISVVN